MNDRLHGGVARHPALERIQDFGLGHHMRAVYVHSQVGCVVTGLEAGQNRDFRKMVNLCQVEKVEAGAIVASHLETRELGPCSRDDSGVDIWVTRKWENRLELVS